MNLSSARQWFVAARGARTAASVLIAVSLLSMFTLSKPPDNAVIDESVALDGLDLSAGGPATEETAVGVGAARGTGISGSAGPIAGQPGSRKFDCAKGQNAGSTEVGVTAKEIRFAATVVKTGVAKDFLSDAQFGIEAVRQKVNRAGGICGRIIKIDYDNDEWDSGKGQRIIESYISSNKYFGLAVNPSSEGLRGAINSGLIRQNRFPVIGADGMLINQYLDPWVWPVATSTSSVMHIMAANAYARGARTFGIVYETNYAFGVEGRLAFKGTVERLGATVIEEPILGDQQSYSNQVNNFITNCGGAATLNKCDFIAMLLEPSTASQWVTDKGLGNGRDRPRIGIGAPQPLFVTSFVRNCGNDCSNMWAWTSFKPPIPPFDTDPAVAMYKADLANVNTQADANNPHVQGAYVGMMLVVEALEQLGPAPTRAGIKTVLDAMRLETMLSQILAFAPGNHYANIAAQSFEVITNNGSFSNWRNASDFITDVDVGKDIPPDA